jgi:hypothetical protein
MPRSTTKADLLAQTIKQRDALLALLAQTPPERLQVPGAGGWSAKDVISHLAEWEHMVLSWHEIGLRGEKPAIPGVGYKWNQLPALNQAIYETHKSEPLEAVLAGWQESSQRLLAFIEAASEEDLFTRGRFAWTGTSAVGDYAQSCGPSHYTWAIKEIRSRLKAGA